MAKKSKRNHQKPEAEETNQPQKKPCEDEQDEHGKSFEELGLDPRLLRALLKKGIEKPFPIQSVAIPLVLQGKDVVAQARTGTGKTLAYLLPLLHKLFSSDIGPRTRAAPAAFILVPTRELCQQVHKEASSLIELCRAQLKVVQLNSSMPNPDLQAALAGCPDVLVTTPKCLRDCFSSGLLQSTAVNESLEFLVLDEADLLLQFRFEDDLKTLTAVIPKRCQCLLMSATTSSDVDQLKKMLLQNPFVLTLSEVEDLKKEIISKNVHQYWISCNPGDKLLYILALLKLDRVVEKKVLIFTNSIDMGFRLKLFLEKFGIKSAILNAELPQNSRLHILEGFNAGLFDYLIATDDSQRKEKDESSENNRGSRKSKKQAKPKLDSEFGVVRGIDFKRVETIINFDMPSSVDGYVHRIGRTGRAYRGGSAVSLVSPDEMEVFREINSFLGDNGTPDVIKEFPSSIKNAAESLRYRAEDVAKSVTKIAVREARAQDLRNEILNSEKLKAHFEANPKDLDLLKHDKVLSKKLPAPHLRDLPSYLIDRKTQEASKIIRLTDDALQQKKTDRQQRSKKKFKRSRDPLRTFSAGVSKKSGTKREMKGGDAMNKPKQNRS